MGDSEWQRRRMSREPGRGRERQRPERRKRKVIFWCVNVRLGNVRSF